LLAGDPALLEERYAQTFACQEICGRAADDATADDCYVDDAGKDVSIAPRPLVGEARVDLLFAGLQNVWAFAGQRTDLFFPRSRIYRVRGLAVRPGLYPSIAAFVTPEPAMRVLLTTFGSRGDVQPLLALGVTLRALGADARVCAPPDDEFVKMFAAAAVPLLPAFTSVRDWIAEMIPKRATISLPQLAAQVMAAQYPAISAAAQGCDVMVATGLFSSVVAARAVAEKQRIRYVHAAYCPMFLPSPHQRPMEYPGHPHPPGVTDNQALWDRDVQVMDDVFGPGLNALRASVGLPKVVNVRDHAHGERPWLAADPVLAPWRGPARTDVVQTGAWILPDERPLPADLLAFLDAGTPPVYAGFGSLPAPKEFARMAIDVVRAQGRRMLLSRGWAELALIDNREDCFVVGEVNQQALFPRVAAAIHHGGAGTTTVAARAGAPQVVVPQIGDQPYWAGRVWDLGVGAAHPGPTPTAESLSTALEAALNSGTRARALAVAETIVSDGAMRAARLLLGSDPCIASQAGLEHEMIRAGSTSPEEDCT
jgi:vancomycin aglycone glucosyltransferase